MTVNYELYRCIREDHGICVTLRVDDDNVIIENYTVGEMCGTFFGRYDHESRVTVDSARARLILDHFGMADAGSPTQALADLLVSDMTGRNDVASRLKGLAATAGVEVDLYAW